MTYIRKIMIFLIVLLSITFIFPTFSFAHENLDNLYDDFRRSYTKDDVNSLRLAQKKNDGETIWQRQLLIKVSDGAHFEAERFGVTLVDGFNDLEANHIYVVQVPKSADMNKKIGELEQAEGIEYVEPDYVVTGTAAVDAPQDPYFKQQWYLDRIALLKAWKVTKGSENVSIAVIDSGVHSSHPDLESRILEGYNFVNDSVNVEDHFGHGTHVTGIIAANENQIGITGIDQGAKILPIKAMGKDGTGSLSHEIDSIYYAIDQNVDIINMSYVTDKFSELENEVLWKAYDAGIVSIAAAGNYGRNKVMYPGNYPQVISVSATTKNDTLASFSNYGAGIDIAAPGEEIYSTAMNGKYNVGNGTSFAAPIVSGVAGLVKAAGPDMTPNEIRYVLHKGAESLQGLEWDNRFGYGRVNAAQTLQTDLSALSQNPGNKSKDAVKVGRGDKLKGRMDLPLDVDWYTFKVEEKDEVTIDIRNEANHSDLFGVLYGKKGQDYEQIAVIDDHGMGKDEQFIKKLDKGSYYLAISDFFGRWSEDAYELEINDYEKPPYADVKEYRKQIAFLTDKHIISGFPDGMFKPNNNVTRIQAVKMILLAKGINVENYEAPNPHFKDMTRDDDGYQEVAVAVDLGIIQGKVDNRFDPWGNLKRAQMASILAKAYEVTGERQAQFLDIPHAHWAYDEIQALAANNIVNGYADNRFKPNKQLSRQHFAVFLYNILTMDEGA